MVNPSILTDIAALPVEQAFGRITAIQGLLAEASGLERRLSIGDRVQIHTRDGKIVPGEAVGFRNDSKGRPITLILPFKTLEGIGIGARVDGLPGSNVVRPSPAWLGRVVNGFGEPIDGKGPLPPGPTAFPVRTAPPNANARARLGGKIDLGIRALNTFLTCCRGQRLGIFSGSGVGKSILLSMLARYTSANVSVIGLVGERGREVQEFIQDDLGPEGLARSVVVVATSDEAPLLRRQAAFLTLAVAEYFRSQGKDVLCMIDSITRFAMSQREIGLSAGEPPTTKGYPPTVFSELPRLLERAGPGLPGEGTITGLFSVLVDGDDHNEPIADAARGILDGHIVLDRTIAQRNRYPAVNILKSISRVLPECNSAAENALVERARTLLATYENMAEMIRLGAYRKGSDSEIDQAIAYYDKLENFLRQGIDERADLAGGYRQLAELLGMPAP